MRKIVICEDEKMIRLGIQSIVTRSSVPFEEIFLCKNGEEAYEIIKNHEIDLLITDIRMPKKDGITLVKEIQDLPHVPKVVVISGYDDFSYAVELLRYGAKDYILKPIERDKLCKILEQLEQEYQEEQITKDVKQIGIQQLKYILLNNNITEAEIMSIEKQLSNYFLQDEYSVICTNFKPDSGINLESVIYLDDISGHSVFIIKSDAKKELLESFLKNQYVGISSSYKYLRTFRNAFSEALEARKESFFRNKYVTEYNRTDDKTGYNENELIPFEAIDKYVQMLGTDKLEEVKKFLVHFMYKTGQGRISYKHFEEVMISIIESICTTYSNILEDGENKFLEFKNIYSYDNADAYIKTFISRLESINEKLMTEFLDYKNKQKIKKAIIYINENYSKDLNMAVVSNYISMNYSLFSSLFKQIVGVNFVTYLKNIRINEAKRLLECTDKKVIEISNLVGYENEKNFMKIFKSVCGVSPSEYRKNVQMGKQKILM